jgi:hypothetical protein
MDCRAVAAQISRGILDNSETGFRGPLGSRFSEIRGRRTPSPAGFQGKEKRAPSAVRPRKHSRGLCDDFWTATSAVACAPAPV